MDLQIATTATTMATTTSATATTAEQGDSAAVDDIAISLPPEDRLSPAIDEIQGPLASQLFEFSEIDLFPDTLQEESENFPYAANLSFPSDVDKMHSSEPLKSNKLQNYPNENSTSTSGSTIATATETPIITDSSNTLSIIFDSQDELDNTISASIDFSTSPPYSGAPYLTITHQDQLDFSSVDPEVQITDPVVSFMAPTLPSVYEENCLSMMPPFLRLNPSTSSSFTFHDPPSMESFLPGTLNSTLVADNSGIYNKNFLVGSELQSKEPQYLRDASGSFCPDQLQRVYNSSDIQSLSNDNQQLVNGAVSTPLSTDISSLEDSTFKTGKLSAEERKEKIHKYMKKRNERNFNKKIKYACRKTLADSRPRVRGRFAKNDDFGDTNAHTGSQHEDYDYDEVHAAVKEEDDLVNSSDIFGHISGVNAFNCGFPIQSWI